MGPWERSNSEMPLFVHIALGIFLGGLAVAFVLWQVTLWQIERAADETARALSRAGAAAAQAARDAKLSADQREAARQAQAASVQQAAERARLQAAEEAARRETAWKAYYRKPAACDEARGGGWSVECANDFMRAKKRFDDLYDAGQL